MTSKRQEISLPIDLTALPTPDQLTLLFKCGKSTTLLSVFPTQSFSEIKAMLLAALRARNIFSLPGSDEPLPEDSSHFQFGVLRDRKDATKGWKPLVLKEQASVNGKAGKKKASGKQEVASEGPAGAGLTDGSWLAYRVAPEADNIDDDEMSLDLDDTSWNVVLPSYDNEDIET